MRKCQKCKINEVYGNQKFCSSACRKAYNLAREERRTESDIKIKRAPCGQCKHGVVEPRSWIGHKCQLNAAYCSPTIDQRLFEAAV